MNITENLDRLAEWVAADATRYRIAVTVIVTLIVAWVALGFIAG